MDTVHIEKARNMRGYHHGHLRTALQDVALTVLDEAGIEAVTLREVARRAGVAHSAPANHFRDRKALLTAVAVEVTREVAGVVRAAFGEATEQRSRFRAVMVAALRYALAHPHRYRLINHHGMLDMTDTALVDAQQEIFATIAAAFELPDKTAFGRETYVIAVWSMVHGYISLRLDGTLVAGFDEVTGCSRELALIDLLIGGHAR
jgi:AcrR family transcriptional regulator